VSTPSDPTDHRSTARLPAPSNVWLQCRRGIPGCGADLANGVLDISEGGLQFLSKQSLAVADVVELVIGSATRFGTIRRPGEVRWVVPLGGSACCVGVRFHQPLTADELQTLLRLPASTGAAEELVLDLDADLDDPLA
jgi:hypothetical protein